MPLHRLFEQKYQNIFFFPPVSSDWHCSTLITSYVSMNRGEGVVSMKPRAPARVTQVIVQTLQTLVPGHNQMIRLYIPCKAPVANDWMFFTNIASYPPVYSPMW